MGITWEMVRKRLQRECIGIDEEDAHAYFKAAGFYDEDAVKKAKEKETENEQKKTF